MLKFPIYGFSRRVDDTVARAMAILRERPDYTLLPENRMSPGKNSDTKLTVRSDRGAEAVSNPESQSSLVSGSLIMKASRASPNRRVRRSDVFEPRSQAR